MFLGRSSITEYQLRGLLHARWARIGKPKN